jgi:glyoxylase-like metal-dependent hydrolase (beta-lactamase superfamily II)
VRNPEGADLRHPGFPREDVDLLPVCSGRELVVAYSHADWDHVWGTCGLSQVEVIAHAACARRFEDLDDVARTLREYQGNYQRELAGIRLVAPQRTFETSLTLDLGGITVEFFHCPGHTKDSIVALVPERSLLMGADCIETPIPILNEGAENLQLWIETLSKLERDLRIDICVPSHGTIGGREILRNNISYLQSLSGEANFEIPSPLDDFYKAAHQSNRDKTSRLREQRTNRLE